MRGMACVLLLAAAAAATRCGRRVASRWQRPPDRRGRSGVHARCVAAPATPPDAAQAPTWPMSRRGTNRRGARYAPSLKQNMVQLVGLEVLRARDLSMR